MGGNRKSGRFGSLSIHLFPQGTYFQGAQGLPEGGFFYPVAEVVFIIKDTESHYHVPLLLSPFGFSTYRGS